MNVFFISTEFILNFYKTNIKIKYYYCFILYEICCLYLYIIFSVKENAIGGNLWQHCPWMRPHKIDWIYEGPTISVLLLNLAFLLAIMWVLITKLRSANTLETQQYRKAAKALLVLMPLLGVTYVLIMKSPSTDEVTNIIFDYIRAVLLSTQVFILYY